MGTSQAGLTGGVATQSPEIVARLGAAAATYITSAEGPIGACSHKDREEKA